MIKKFIASKPILLIILFAIFSATTFELINRPLIGPTRSIEISLDNLIPFIKQFILIYHLFMPCLIVFALILLKENKQLYLQYIFCLFFSQILAYIIYLFWQTEIPRYNINLLGSDFFSKLVRLTYMTDNNYNGCPSLHVSQMLSLIIFSFKSKITIRIKIPMVILAFLIAISTVLVKQHVILDILGGILLSSFVCIFIFNSKRILNFGELLN